MISPKYIELLTCLRFYHLNDYMSTEEGLEKFKMDWQGLKYAYKNESQEAFCDQLFNASRRAIELTALIQKITCDIVIDDLIKLHEKKNAGYSGQDPDAWKNFRECEEFEIEASVGVLTRLCDKYRRFWTVFDNPSNNQVNESALDTLQDFAAYCLILICILEEGKPNENK